MVGEKEGREYCKMGWVVEKKKCKTTNQGM